MDILQSYHEFSRACADALNEAGVRPVMDGKEVCCALLAVVHPAQRDGRDPIGGALNWDQETGLWSVDTQVQQPRGLTEEEFEDEKRSDA